MKHGSRLRTLAVQRQHLLLQGTATITWLTTHLSSSQRCTTLKQVMHPSHARAPGRRPLCFLRPPLNCFSGLLFIHNPCAARQAAHSDMLPWYLLLPQGRSKSLRRSTQTACASRWQPARSSHPRAPRTPSMSRWNTTHAFMWRRDTVGAPHSIIEVFWICLVPFVVLLMMHQSRLHQPVLAQCSSSCGRWTSLGSLILAWTAPRRI